MQSFIFGYYKKMKRKPTNTGLQRVRIFTYVFPLSRTQRTFLRFVQRERFLKPVSERKETSVYPRPRRFQCIIFYPKFLRGSFFAINVTHNTDKQTSFRPSSHPHIARFRKHQHRSPQVDEKRSFNDVRGASRVFYNTL